MTPENKQLLQDLARTSYGKALSEFLGEELSILKDVNNAKSWDDTLANQKASRIIEKLFNFMQEKKTTDKVKTTFT